MEDGIVHPTLDIRNRQQFNFGLTSLALSKQNPLSLNRFGVLKPELNKTEPIPKPVWNKQALEVWRNPKNTATTSSYFSSPHNSHLLSLTTDESKFNSKSHLHHSLFVDYYNDLWADIMNPMSSSLSLSVPPSLVTQQLFAYGFLSVCQLSSSNF